MHGAREPWPRWLVVLVTAAVMLLLFGLAAVWTVAHGPGMFGGIEPPR